MDATQCGRTPEQDQPHPTTTPKPNRHARRIKLWFAALLLLALAVRLIDPIGWLGADDASYHAAAEHVVHGEPIRRIHHHYARSPIVIAVAVSMMCFGDSPAALILPTLISSILCIVIVVLIGRHLWGWWVGLLAGTIIAFLPAFQNTSTCLLPGAYTCCLAAAAILATIMATGATQPRTYWCLGLAAGMLAAMATSVKLFTGAVFVGIAFLAWQRHTSSRGRRLVWMGLVIAGAALFVLLECTFYTWTADDFWFKFQALAGSRGTHTMLPGSTEAYVSLSQTLRVIISRLTMPFRLTDSGWGVTGYAFWPAILVGMFGDRRTCGLAVWASVTFLGVAFVPISIANGVYLFPAVGFNGVNLIALCVPFSLCLAWAIHQLATTVFRRSLFYRTWPVALIAVLAVSNFDRYRTNKLGPFRQQQVASAIRRMIATVELDEGLPIFTTPSIYWRYRVLFPKPLRHRLRVAADADAPRWWRDVCYDIRRRWRPLPSPEHAYLIATPEHLRGQELYWDYGVGLPKKAMTNWNHATAIATAIRRHGIITIQPRPAPNAPGSILCLLGPAAGKMELASSQ
ncbi:MAG: glycosyltransferase family 39 protein [Phycisphaerae bacterium]